MKNEQKPKIGDKVTVTEGSSEGHVGTVIAIKQKGVVRIKRDVDGVECDTGWYYIHRNKGE